MGLPHVTNHPLGATALAYFGPQFFQKLVGKGDKDILLTALFGAVKLAATSIFILLIVERFPRRYLLIGGPLGMAACMLSTALVYKYEPAATGSGDLTPQQAATVALIFINIVFYNWSWGPLPWAYVPEIFPTRTRALGMAVAMSSHWLFSFVFSFSTPYMLEAMGWGIFLFYACFDVAMAVFCFFFIKETKGKTLERVREEMERDSEGISGTSAVIGDAPIETEGPKAARVRDRRTNSDLT